MSSDREGPDEDRGSRQLVPAALLVAAFVLTALPLAVASALPVAAGARAFDLPGVALLLGTVSL